MKRILAAVAIAASTITAPALAGDVGVSISVGQPGFYGRLDLGGYPAPVLIYPEPRIVHRVTVERPPIYLRVPPGHAKNWRKYCHRYDACGERVYFIQDNWYHHEYVPRYREQHSHYYERRDDRHDRRHDRRDDRYERRDERRDDWHDRR